MHKVMDLPDSWQLHADDAGRPILVHEDGRRVEPKQFASEYDATAVYRALKLEEDKRSRLETARIADWGADSRQEMSSDWNTIWSARVVIGDFFNRKTHPESTADRLLNEELEKQIRREQRERARMWN